MVWQVEELATQLQTIAFPQGPVLRQRGVDVRQRGTDEDVASGISVAIDRNVLRTVVGDTETIDERREVEPIARPAPVTRQIRIDPRDRKSTRLNSSHVSES